jgi:tetratricopeptide (TPR) repeat protein
MQLDDALYDRIKELSERGNQLRDAGKFLEAVAAFTEALELLPPPREQWEAATWLLGSLGEAHFQNQDYAQARDAFLDSFNCPDGIDNPFLQLRLGESLLELGDRERAKEHLLRAYMSEGKAIFQDEPPHYLAFLKEQVKLA